MDDQQKSRSANCGEISATSARSNGAGHKRHSAADVAKFGVATPYAMLLWGDATNYLAVYWSAANTLKIEYNAGDAGVHRKLGTDRRNRRWYNLFWYGGLY